MMLRCFLLLISHSFVFDRVHLQLEPQHRKAGAIQELSLVKIQLNPAITNF